MSKRELGRVKALARVRSKQLRLVDAARLMRVCYRQAKRLWKRYREEGAAGLKHRSAGRRSHHAYEPKYRGKVLGLVREKYGGPVGERFGPTLAAEHLASEDGLQVNGETLRRWMLAEGLWSRERKRRRHRRRRERKEHFGEMVQPKVYGELRFVAPRPNSSRVSNNIAHTKVDLNSSLSSRSSF